MAKLEVPFTPEAALFTEPNLPAVFWEGDTLSSIKPIREGATEVRALKVCENLRRFYTIELDVSVFDDVIKYLQLAGATGLVPSLTTSLHMGLEIGISEVADRHLLCTTSRITIKPFPTFLGLYSAWTDTINTDEKLHQHALGFLLSYMWLIRHESDLAIARNHELMPESVTWEKWTQMSSSVFDHINFNAREGISPRYWYGHLDIDRVGKIWLLNQFSPRLLGSYMTILVVYDEYKAWARSNLAFIGTVLAYLALILTAMQVGLATTRLQDNDPFQRASYGFTVLAILGPTIFLCFLVAFIFFKALGRLIVYRNNPYVESRV